MKICRDTQCTFVGLTRLGRNTLTRDVASTLKKAICFVGSRVRMPKAIIIGNSNFDLFIIIVAVADLAVLQYKSEVINTKYC